MTIPFVPCRYVRRPLAALLVTLTLAGLAIAGCGSDGDDPASTATSEPSQEQQATPPPTATAPPSLWPLPTDASANIARAGLPALPTEFLNYHVHAHLDIFVDGKPVTVPEFLGIDLRARLISPLHTHDTSGIVHIEAQQPQVFTLGQLFIEWGVRLDANCLGDFCKPQTPVRAFVNGTEVMVDPASIQLQDKQAIVLTTGVLPASVPTSFDFPAGY